MQIGFIGLGIMGRPMALNLKKAGHEILVPERASLTAEIRAAATVLADATAVARAAELVILMLPDTPDVEQVLFGANGVADGLSAGKLVIDMSSIDPLATKRFAERIAGLGCHYLDAPVSGGEVGATQATLTIMVGGPEAAFRRAEPLFAAMGKSITHIGAENGAGQICKVANQIVVALNIEAVAEALLFASRAGADPARVRAALLGGFAASRVLEVHGQRMLDHSFAPGFRVRLHQKDLNLALSAARQLGLALPNTASAQQLFSAVVAHGGADRDHAAMLEALEELAAHKVHAPG
ncbi:MAG: 2-hydroxy-3-oxopropionate reductase [Acidibrevibacterium sp.]|jgi:2-hydroxy-3-oxopropionate reductase|uniref:2-hydroxy-3-oxopropionate reductase n=1 Tax=Acidibrevibacterium fodinaquatile TaxID=1969806 RepID=UPI0023A79513|nr:2-hydroxy-3-oxopropionate reductase [Acidibrevibacterium fodinaquatile]MCA7118748.1 2-hydroxy-3-oxopropionate reductase [Acidibrevibacterium fodinaquatile]